MKPEDYIGSTLTWDREDELLIIRPLEILKPGQVRCYVVKTFPEGIAINDEEEGKSEIVHTGDTFVWGDGRDEWAAADYPWLSGSGYKLITLPRQCPRCDRELNGVTDFPKNDYLCNDCRFG